MTNRIKVNAIYHDNKKINITGLADLLSDINLWSPPENKKTNYKRKVVRKNGKTFTVISPRRELNAK